MRKMDELKNKLLEAKLDLITIIAARNRARRALACATNRVGRAREFVESVEEEIRLFKEQAT